MSIWISDESIEVVNKKVKKYLKKGLEIQFNVDDESTKASKIVKAFNLNPKVEILTFYNHNNLIIDDGIPEKINSGLKVIEIHSSKNPHKFLNSYLRENSIVEYKSYNRSDKDKSEIKKFFMLQKSIRKVTFQVLLLCEIICEIDKSSFTEINLEICGKFIPMDLLGMFTNLKILRTQTSQKLQGFAKFLPGLEELCAEYERSSFIYELDFKIKSENLTILKITNLENNLCISQEIFLEILKSFPNLEAFAFEFYDGFHSYHLLDYDCDVSEDVLIELNKMKNLRYAQIRNIPLQRSINFTSVLNEIVKLSKKFMTMEIKVEPIVPVGLKRESFLRMLKEFKDSEDGKEINVWAHDNGSNRPKSKIIQVGFSTPKQLKKQETLCNIN